MASDGTRILMFHRVLPDTPAAFGLPRCYRMRGTALTPAELRRALDGAGPVHPLSAVERALAQGVDPPRGAVLTFDDGYREHLDVVAPLLRERGVSATFYVATGLHGRGDVVAVVDAWYWLLDHATAPEAAVPMPDGSTFRGRLDCVDGKAAWVGGSPKAGLLEAAPEHQRRMLDALADEVRCTLPADLAARLYLRPEEWSALACLGMRIGAHSLRHPRLTQVSDADLDEEVALSLAAVSSVCAPVTFAYPDGAYDDGVVERVRRGGASSAVTCIQGVVVPRTDLMRLPRLFVTPQDLRTDFVPALQ